MNHGFLPQLSIKSCMYVFIMALVHIFVYTLFFFFFYFSVFILQLLLMLLCYFLLQDMAYELKNELASQLLTLNVSSFSMAPVKVCRFDHSDVSLTCLPYPFAPVIFHPLVF